MVCVTLLIAFSALVHESFSSPIVSSKSKPVDLAHVCMSLRPKEVVPTADHPIIFLHGLGASKEAWSGVSEVIAMATARKVCLVDLRNHGESPWDDNLDVEAMASDIEHFMITQGFSKAILLGHSLGGKLALHFTVNNPERVEKLIVEDMRPNSATEEAKSQTKALLTLFMAAIKSVPENATELEAKLAVIKFVNTYLSMFGSSFTLDSKDADMLPIRCSEGKCFWKTNPKLFEAIMKDDEDLLTESTGVFEGPALFIYGADSPFKVGDDESSIMKMFPKAKLVGVEGAGHTVHSSPKFMDSVIKFIKDSS